MALSADLSKLLVKQYEYTDLSELLKATVPASAGPTDKDGELLEQVLNIETVGNVGRNRFSRGTQALVGLAESGK